MADDILSQLPLLRWRNLDPPPYDLVSFEWDNVLAARGVPYVDVDVHDNVRRGSARFKARLYFCEVLQAGAFSKLWPNWLQALKLGDADYLVHPLLGTLRARVAKAGGEVKAQVRDGVIVDVEWVETNEDPSTASADLATEVDIVTTAADLDDSIAELGLTFPDGSFATSFTDAFDQINGELFSFGMSVSGALAQVIGSIDSLISDVKALEDHAAWPVLDQLYGLWYATRQMESKLAATARATATKTTATDTTLEAFAAEVGNTLQELMGLNLSALRAPVVPKGTALRYYTGK